METRELNPSTDRISNIPRNLRDTILTHMPLREAARASVLSKEWNFSWKNLSTLVFDDTLCHMSTNYDDRLLTRYKLFSIINQILLLHQGPILKFSFTHFLIDKGREIDHLMNFLSNNGVEEFEFKTKPLMGCLSLKYKMPLSFFSFKQLKHLELSACVFNPPQASLGFPRLITLKFVRVSISNSLFGKFISKCQKLERLTLIEVYDFQFVEITAAKLEYICLEEVWMSFHFKSVPRLQSASIQPFLKYNEINGSVVDFFARMPSLKKLIMNHYFLEGLAGHGVPRKLPTSTNLRILELKGISFYDLNKLAVLYCLISSSPKIQRIEIIIKLSREPTKDTSPIKDFLKTHDYASEMILHELVEISLTYFTGAESELDFIKLLLAKSPILEKIRIEMARPTNADTGLKILREVVKFQRASPVAQIIYE